MCAVNYQDGLDLEEITCVSIPDTDVDTVLDEDDDDLMAGVAEELDAMDGMIGGVEYEVSRVQLERIMRGVSPVVRFV